MLGLNALDAIHKLRKELSRSFVLGQKGIWPEAEEALPKHHWQSLAKTIDQNFWAVLIGNNKYTDSGPGKKLDDLKGAINFTQYGVLLIISQVALTTLNCWAIIWLST